MGGVTILKANWSRYAISMLSLTNKAPSFDQVTEFEKKANSLFPVQVHVTEQGLVFINLTAGEDVIPFEVIRSASVAE